MVRAEMTNEKGLVQYSGAGGFKIVNSAMGEGQMGVALTAGTTSIVAGAHDVEMSLTQPAGTVLTDIGVVALEATAGAANIIVRVGTTDDGEELCEDANFVTSGVAVIGSMISQTIKGEGGALMPFIALPILYTAAARTIYVRAQVSATNSAGTLRGFAKFMKI